MASNDYLKYDTENQNFNNVLSLEIATGYRDMHIILIVCSFTYC